MGSRWVPVGMVTAVLCAGAVGPVAAQGDPSPAALSALKREYRRPAALPVENQTLADLGRDLFFDPKLSASGTTACVGCHLPELGWVVTEPRSRNDSGKLTSRKSQPLIGLGHAGAASVGWDGRSPTLEAQAKASIATGSMSMRETDRPVKVEVIEARIKSDAGYVAKFNKALPNAAITLDTIAQALAAFERTLEPGRAAFDRWIEGDEQAISESAKRGFVLFNGKANCFACHGGWRFTDDRFHDIGVATTDRGRGRDVKDDELMQFAFKTPTLRSVALRPPFMHDGSVPSLYDVMRLYEKGGIDRPSRSPMMLPLTMTEQERLDLVAFLETLTGAIDEARAKQ